METNRVIYWHEMLGNPYRYGLHPLMLSENGYRHQACVKIRGSSKVKSAGIPVTIIFDENYVRAYINKLIFQKLEPSNYNEFQKIISKVWREWKEQAKTDEQ